MNEAFRSSTPIAAGAIGVILLLQGAPVAGDTSTAELSDGRALQVEYEPAQVDAAFLEGPVVGNYFALPEGPLLNVEGDFEGRRPLPAGLYSIGLVKQRDGGFYIALYPGDIRQARRAPRLNIIIPLVTSSVASAGANSPLMIDIVENQGAALLKVELADVSLEGQLN